MSDDKSKPKKNIILSAQKKKELEGFQEVLDLVNIDKEKATIEVNNNKKDMPIEDYQIYDFLEKEVARLEKLDQFFTVQMPLEKKYSQTKKLIQKESSELSVIKDEIIELTSQNESNLYNFLDDLIRRTY